MRKTFFLALVLLGVISANAASWYAPDNNYPQPQDPMERSLKKINSLLISNLLAQTGVTINATNLTNANFNADGNVTTNILIANTNLLTAITNVQNAISNYLYILSTNPAGTNVNVMKWGTQPVISTNGVLSVYDLSPKGSVVLTNNGSLSIPATVGTLWVTNGTTNAYQLATDTTRFSSITFGGYADPRTTNTGTVWISYAGTNESAAIPLLSGKYYTLNAPPYSYLYATNIWLQNESTNDGVVALWELVTNAAQVTVSAATLGITPPLDVNQGALTNTVDWVTAIVTNTVPVTANVTNSVNVVLQSPSTSLVNGSFLLSCTGDTNVPVQLSATNFPVHSATLSGYSNRVINTSTIWVQYSGNTNSQAVPLTAGNAMNISAPDGALLNLSNVWVQAETTNDSVGVLYAR